MSKRLAHKKNFSPQSRSSSGEKPAALPTPSPDSLNLIHYLLNHIGDEVMLIDRNARIVFVNDATVNGLGLSREKLLTRRVTDFLEKKISVRSWQNKEFAQLKKVRSPRTFRLQRVTGKGQIQIIDVTAVYMPYKSEEFILSVARDRTQELALQQRLKESDDLFRLISEGAGDGIIACDLQGRLTYVNPALESLIGVPAASLTGRRFVEYIAKDSFNKVLECFTQARKGANNIREEIELITTRNVRIPVEINVSPLYKGKEIVSIHAVVRDIRSRRHLEIILRQSEKMQSIQTFVAGMAKEIKDPLFAVMSLTKKLTERYKNRDFEYIGYNEFAEMMKALEQIHSRAKYSYETTQRLIDLNKKRSGIKNDYCYPNDALFSCLRLRQGQWKLHNIRLKLNLSKQLPAVNIGKIEMIQIIDNILNNATQAMPGGGVLTIRSVFLKSQSRVQLDIQDTGVGISHEDLPHIFEPFFTTKYHGSGKSAGLGLPIVSELLKAVQGNIRVQSSLREGTAITILLPIRKGKAGQGRLAAVGL